ncbi:MAG: hypothetical protein KKI12_08155 [Proteobacteria bacterium]|nr:hypothetical protein [Candidatus Omnitrophota bacterium]MBU4288126.1 hypothetical protein [Pseudomonadota bacterium]MBU4504213.1 hypothetical protein [Pseudomonadota bacterium]MCG2831451.1 hypothetical protein [Desulfobacteraceae bacterium]
MESTKNNYTWKGIVFGFLLGIIAGVISPLGVEFFKLQFFSPDIEFKFEAKSPYVISTVFGIDEIREYFSVIEFRFLIENTSKHHSADSYSVMLTGLWHKEGESFVSSKNFEPIKLRQYPYMPSSISPGMRIFVPFARIAHPDYQKKFDSKLYSGNPEIPQFRFQVPNYPRWMSSHVEPGIHRFQITVFFDNRPPVSKMFEFQWPEKRVFSDILSNIRINMKS